MQRTHTPLNWKNKNGTGDRSCKCGSWHQHWLNMSKLVWYSKCSVEFCNNKATLGAHVINSNISGEFIIPMCASCNQFRGTFNFKYGVTLISANKAETCEKRTFL